MLLPMLMRLGSAIIFANFAGICLYDLAVLAAAAAGGLTLPLPGWIIIPEISMTAEAIFGGILKGDWRWNLTHGRSTLP